MDPALGGTGIMDYTAGKIADYDFVTQVIAQCKAVLLTLVWSGVGSLILYKVVDIIVGLRPTVEKEREGLDLTDHGERAYNMYALGHRPSAIRLGRIPGTAPAVGGPRSQDRGLSLLRLACGRRAAMVNRALTSPLPMVSGNALMRRAFPPPRSLSS